MMFQGICARTNDSKSRLFHSTIPGSSQNVISVYDRHHILEDEYLEITAPYYAYYHSTNFYWMQSDEFVINYQKAWNHSLIFHSIQYFLKSILEILLLLVKNGLSSIYELEDK